MSTPSQSNIRTFIWSTLAPTSSARGRKRASIQQGKKKWVSMSKDGRKAPQTLPNLKLRVSISEPKQGSYVHLFLFAYRKIF
jgi:hypothetical protein